MSLPYATPFYSQNGTIQVLLQGINFGSALATIINPKRQSHQSLNQQLRQAFETVQLLELLLGQDSANHFIQSSLFYLSFGKDDYIRHFLDNSSGISLKYNGQSFAKILVNQMGNAIRDLYDVNVRKIVCLGILPLGCAPRILWERHNDTIGAGNRGCEDEINKLVLQYNTMLEEQIIDLNAELSGAHIIFCDVYRGIMEIITNPEVYGFEDVRNACCGLGTYGGESGCLSTDMACDQASTHLWWDLYNPSQAVNSLLADSAWSGQRIPAICRPFTVQKLVSYK
ncbi:unnamed protein product [Ilex paraguariensis]|uniref:GDSL esterase/lipase n=1 Tax=Ilex paraguariensis TaxID=185542 RepID=A0ABC8TGJ5_9AQUA